MKTLPALSLRSMLFALPLVMFGCEQGQMPPYSTQESAPMLVTEARDYDPKDLVTVRLTNVTPRYIRHDLCRSGLERYSDGEWNIVQPIVAEACTAGSRGLAPGQSVAFSFRVVQPTRKMQYRVRAEIEDSATGARSAVVSNSFSMSRGRED